MKFWQVILAVGAACALTCLVQYDQAWKHAVPVSTDKSTSLACKFVTYKAGMSTNYIWDCVQTRTGQPEVRGKIGMDTPSWSGYTLQFANNTNMDDGNVAGCSLVTSKAVYWFGYGDSHYETVWQCTKA